ncbi:amino acid transporter ['Osedax' symbiont bacterium Rs2_46_30_T18]|nr:amino acid transporter ['Osedax' symbiont bacterium Rs2_46_30_T18]
MWFFPFLKGMGIGASLIMAIGTQNAFVLSSALRKQHAFVVGSVCVVIDVILIFSGVLGLGALITAVPVLIVLASYFGAAFLFVYGAIAFRRALSPKGLATNSVKAMTVAAAIATTTGLSLLNPHVYLDTVILLGSIGGQLPDNQPIWFALGASVSSALWFLILVVGGKALAPWFNSEKSWQKLDILVGSTMWVIALLLILSTF